MKKLYNRIIPIILAFYLLFSIVEPAVAAETFTSSNEPGQVLDMSIEGNTLVFNSFPQEGNYNYIWVEIGEDFDNGFIYENSMPIHYFLPYQDGIYYLQLARGMERYSTFHGYFFRKKFAIKIENGIAEFVDSPVLENNENRYKKNSTSKTALRYYLQPSYWVESDSKEIEKIAEKIVNQNDSDYVKLQKVHDWVANNVWYDYDALYGKTEIKVSALEVLHSKKSVCQGYADLTAAILRSLGIPTKVVAGYGIDDEWTEAKLTAKESNHAWNEAYVDGRWVILDTTWDSDNKYENGVFSTGTGLEERKYFDPTLQGFSLDHKMMENDNYDENKKEIISQGIEISSENLTLKKGKTKQLKVKPLESYIKLKEAKITYTSSKPSVAYVSKTGKIRAKKAGTSNIVTKVKLDGVTVKFKTRVKVK